MNEKTKTTLQVWIWGCVIVAIFIAFIFWLGMQAGKLIFKKPESVEHRTYVLMKDSTETIKWKRAFDSVNTKYHAVIKYMDNEKSTSHKKANKNEDNKKQALSASDSASIAIRDSLRARYRAYIRAGNN